MRTTTFALLSSCRPSHLHPHPRLLARPHLAQPPRALATLSLIAAIGSLVVALSSCAAFDDASDDDANTDAPATSPDATDDDDSTDDDATDDDDNATDDDDDATGDDDTDNPTGDDDTDDATGDDDTDDATDGDDATGDEVCDFDAGECEADEDCAATEFCSFASDEDACGATPEKQCGTCVTFCVRDRDCPDQPVCNLLSGLCGNLICSSDSDCDVGEVCSVRSTPANECTDGGAGGRGCGPAPTITPDACKITSPGTTLAADGTYKVNAIATEGGKAVARAPFTFDSSDDGIATVAADGTVTAAGEGTATISVKTGDVDCGTVEIEVIADPESGKTVVLLDIATGAGIAGATVKLGQGDCADQGAGKYACTGDTGDIHAFADGYNYVSFIGGTTAQVAVIHITPRTPATPPLVKGTFDYVDAQGDLSLGLAGLSIGGNIADLDINLLLGESVPTVLTCESFGLEEEVDLPGGVVLEAPTLCTGAKTEFNASGLPGDRALWGLGGKLFINDVLPTVLEFVSVIGGGDIPVGEILVAVLPFFSAFASGIDPTIELADADITGKTLPLSSPLAIASVATVPNLPTIGAANGTAPDAVLALAGVIDPDLGLVPLGIGAGLDDPDKTGTADGQIDPSADQAGLAKNQFGLQMSRAHGGLEERSGYAFALVALSINGLLDGGAINLSVLVNRAASAGRQLDFRTGSEFLGFAEGSTFVAGSGTLANAPKAASFYRFTLSGADGSWTVYLPKGTTQFTLPTIEGDYTSDAGFRAESVAVEGGFGPADILDASQGKSLARLNDFIKAFSVWLPPPPPPPSP